MKKLYIIGAAGFGREVAWIIEQINQRCQEWEIVGFLDDSKDLQGTIQNGYKVLGKSDFLNKVSEEVWVVCTIGATQVRKEIISKIAQNANIHFATIIAPSAIIPDSVRIGEGTIIASGTIASVNVSIGSHVMINMNCTIGHDTVISDYVTLRPSVDIAGNVLLEECADVGIGAKILQNKIIKNTAVIGGGSGCEEYRSLSNCSRNSGKTDDEKLKILFMAKQTPSALSSLEYLVKQNVDIVGAVVRGCDIQMNELCNLNNIKIITEEDIIKGYQDGFLEVDYILSFYWKRISGEILNIARKGCINFHPGPLPEARGSGYHMAILENWGYWGVTAHYMDEAFDTGAIIQCNRFDIKPDILNCELVRLAHQQAYILFVDIVDKLLAGVELQGEVQGEGRYFGLKELNEMKLIREDENEEQIERKIRAFWNPPYPGAQVEIGGKRYTIIDDKTMAYLGRGK